MQLDLNMKVTLGIAIQVVPSKNISTNNPKDQPRMDRSVCNATILFTALKIFSLDFFNSFDDEAFQGRMTCDEPSYIIIILFRHTNSQPFTIIHVLNYIQTDNIVNCNHSFITFIYTFLYPCDISNLVPFS